MLEGEPLPLFYDEIFTVITDEEKSGRVWRGLQKKLSSAALACLAQCWLAEEPETPMLLFRYIRKAIDAPRSIETNFADPDVLEFSRMWKRVDWERIRLLQFVRFQKAADGTFFAAIEPEKNALPLVTGHFKDRFADQRWLIYDIRRAYGYYYDLKEVRQVTFGEDSREGHLVTGMLDESLMDGDEQLFQSLWKTLFQGNLHQGKAESPQAQARHACAILEVFDREADLVFSLLPSSCCAEQFYAGYSAFRLVSVSSECMYVRFCSLVKCRAARDWHLSAGHK